MSVLEEVGQYLIDQGAADGFGDDLFLNARPDDPTDCLTVYSYPGGGAPEYVQNSQSPNISKVQIQVVGRGANSVTVRAKVQAAWVALTHVFNTILSGTKYRSIMVNGEPGLLGRDQNNLYLIAFNATVEKDVS